ncbi:tRNA (adenosine(37)-N6)-threonylcarbamoyltransferase complex ATPase subunit type 1 TsaE [Patescibacteria group bacterium]|nr:tRNA (adenosine(37)-N6)-threonylcarbamoyltransferase complex ATPase subunit type 1 TsaE [Candidatus Falkowbacteria bacterium]MBU3906196.1 tRNA (adenosine(37)-N6)-threonylcarbamoyltransferase complex ATPase subunit type 1 TsaE [Patescibacteria group bacterium]MCG2698314.1 tRNA (adenosine(37)-N6)-threonylcarbamoyltransferase complex ATPase subunit type 1 TsaE [Candidatus Parcubacteria bacterium]MBU4015581.1 tRNA (adenosine(37)-N6)-threonylcarbamoyltransferase complex ATPase subunit type 1 TsaE 
MQQATTTSEKQTFNLAKKIAKDIKGGEIIGLTGNLGAGKTIFTKGLAAGLGIKQTVNSPTFVLMKVYQIRNQKSEIKNLIHIDAYRIKHEQDIIAIGAQEYFARPDSVTIIEWADKIKKILPKKTRFVNIKNKGGDKRIINI